MSIPLPRLLKDDLSFDREIHPEKVSVELNIIPLSTVSLTVPNDELIEVRRYAEFFTPMGSAGIYRLRSPQYEYDSPTSTLEFEHAITELGDYLIKGEIKLFDTAASAVMTQVFSHYTAGGGSKWQLGSVSLLTTAIDVNFSYKPVLEAMNSILEMMPRIYMTFNFNTTPWTIGFALRDDTISAEGRLGRNVQSATVTYDDSELVTRLFMNGLPKPSSDTDETHYGYLEAETAATYGWVEKEISGGDDYTEDEAMLVASVYLEKHKHPKVSVEIGAEDFSGITGESLDTFTMGKMFRLILPDRTVEENITRLYWDDVYGAPRAVSVGLAEEEDTVFSILSDSSSSGGSGGGGGSQGAGGDKNKYIVYVPVVGTVTVYAKTAQAAALSVAPKTYTGPVVVTLVSGVTVTYQVANGEIQTNQEE